MGGGDYPLMAQEPEGYFLFWRKTHNFKATGIMGGRMGGRPKVGANGGAIFGIHGGAIEAPVSQFVAKKMRFLE